MGQQKVDTNLSISNSYTLHIGIVLQCHENDLFGVVIGYSNSEYCGKMTKIGFPILSYFEKNKEYKIKANTFVVYIVKKDDCNQAFGIKELSSFKIIKDSLPNKIMQVFTPFIYTETRFTPICLYYPLNYNNTKTYFKLNLHLEERALFEYFLELKDIDFNNFPSEEDRKNIFSKIYSYVEYFDIEQELQTYNVIQSAWFQCRPGRDDDHYNMRVERSIESTDSYIRSLLPLGCKLDYYNCSGRGPEEIDFSKRNEEEIENDKTKAKEIYSKKNHINHLINKYYEHLFIEKSKKDRIWSKIECILDYYHILQFCGTTIYDTLTIKKFNKVRQHMKDL